MGARLSDLTGQKFGEWTVLRRGEPDANGNTRWWCRCSCGAEKLVYQMALRNGKSKRCLSCGSRGLHTRRIDLVGRRFGRWLVLEESHVQEQNGRKYLWWWCRCDCGTQQAVRASALLARDRGSKGCSWCRGGRHPAEENGES